MLAKQTMFRLSLLLSLVVFTGCESLEEYADEQPVENNRYVWAGAGEPTNFGADYNYCRNLQNTQQSALGIRDRYRPGSIQQARVDPTTVRRFRSCMLGRGWQET